MVQAIGSRNPFGREGDKPDNAGLLLRTPASFTVTTNIREHSRRGIAAIAAFRGGFRACARVEGATLTTSAPALLFNNGTVETS